MRSETADTTSAAIDQLIAGPQYARTQQEKQRVLLPLVIRLCQDLASACPPYERFLNRLARDPCRWESLADIPPLPVSMFKRFELRGVPSDKVVRVLTSSATTGQRPSRIFLDKTTAFRQSKALAAVLAEHIGKARRPYLVLDEPESAGAGEQISARAAGIRGLGNFARETEFGMSRQPTGQLAPDFERINAFFEKYPGQPMLLFGFTFMVWSAFVLEAERQSVRFRVPQVTLLHSGGWKKLQSQAVTPHAFRQRTADVLGCRPDQILEFYGMVEQVGTVFVDCEQGHKHVPAFADVIMRRPGSLDPVSIGQSGAIEVISVLPTSYPGHVLITEDEGRLAGIDDCPCGRKGAFFDFLRRIERAELRGCGDTFAQATHQT